MIKWMMKANHLITAVVLFCIFLYMENYTHSFIYRLHTWVGPLHPKEDAHQLTQLHWWLSVDSFYSEPLNWSDDYIYWFSFFLFLNKTANLLKTKMMAAVPKDMTLNFKKKDECLFNVWKGFLFYYIHTYK